MVSIKQNFDNFGAALLNAGNTVKNGAKFGASLFVSDTSQLKVEEGFRSAVNSGYGKISGLSSKAVAVMEQEGTQALRGPIKGMKNLNIKRLEIREDQSSNTQSLRNTANKLIGFHEGVIKKSEAASRNVGDKVHAFVRLALSPIRFVAKVLQIESAGAMIQNAVALAVGFIARGIVLAVMQLGHILPYAATAAVIGGAAVGFTLLAKVSPLAAVATGLGLILVGQQAQITNLGKKVDALAYAMKQKQSSKAKTIAQSLVERLQTAKNFLGKNKGKIATGVALGVAGVGAYYYGEQATQAAKQLVKEYAPESVVDALRTVRDTVSANYNSAYNTVSEYAGSAANTVSEYAGSAANTVSEYAGSAANTVSGAVSSAYTTVGNAIGLLPSNEVCSQDEGPSILEATRLEQDAQVVENPTPENEGSNLFGFLKAYLPEFRFEDLFTQEVGQYPNNLGQ